MKLYGAHLSPFVNKVRLQVALKGLDAVEFSAPPGGDLKSPEYLALNPIGKVPTLEVEGGLTIPESTTISEYLEDRFPEPGLRGETPEESARIRTVERLVDIYLYPQLLVLFEQLQERDADKIGPAREGVRAAFGYLEHWMDEEGFAIGGRMTLADCSLAPPLFFFEAFGRFWGFEDFGGSARFGAYWQHVTAVAEVASVIEDMKVALAERQAQS